MNTMNLLPGSYIIDLALEKDERIPVDYYTKAKRFEVYAKSEDIGVARIGHRWEIAQNVISQ